MALSLATQHRKRVERLAQGVKDYARDAGIPETAASRRVLNASHELDRITNQGELISTKMLAAREQRLRELRRQLKREPREPRQAVSA